MENRLPFGVRLISQLDKWRGLAVSEVVHLFLLLCQRCELLVNDIEVINFLILFLIGVFQCVEVFMALFSLRIFRAG